MYVYTEMQKQTRKPKFGWEFLVWKIADFILVSVLGKVGLALGNFPRPFVGAK